MLEEGLMGRALAPVALVGLVERCRGLDVASLGA